MALTVVYVPYSLDSGCAKAQTENSRAGMKDGEGANGRSAAERLWHIYHSQGQILALKTFKKITFPPRSTADGKQRSQGLVTCCYHRLATWRRACDNPTP